MENFEKYNRIHNELMNRLESGEITIETAKEVNDLAFDKYIISEATKDTNFINKMIDSLYHKIDAFINSYNVKTIKHMATSDINPELKTKCIDAVQRCNGLESRAKPVLRKLQKDSMKDENLEDAVKRATEQIYKVERELERVRNYCATVGMDIKNVPKDIKTGMKQITNTYDAVKSVKSAVTQKNRVETN